ncbi:MAG TPA: S8 family serine peptidase [Limnochordales bacterium]|nr:S8 family serine peptidase [Limnochordales bacterium]
MRDVPNAQRTRRRPLAGIALLLLAAVLAGCFGSRPGAGTFGLQGVVVADGAGDAPIAGAVVRVGDLETISGDDGAFSLPQVPVDGATMTVTAVAPGYRSATVLIQPAPGQQLFITVRLLPLEDGDDGGSGDAPPPMGNGAVEALVRLVNAPSGTSAAGAAGARPASIGSAGRLEEELRAAGASRSVVRTAAATVPGQWIVQMNADYPVQAVQDMWAAAGVHVLERLADNFYLVAAPEGASPLETELRLAQLPNVVSVEPNRQVYPVAVPTPNDPYFDQQWSLPLISIPYAWGVTTGSRDVVVAVLDTGLLPQHPDLAGVNIVHGRNFASGQSATNYTDDATDVSHGTMVAGIIAAAANNARGIAGINWNVSIMPVRVMSSRSGGTVAAVGQGIRWAVDNGAHVINMSLAWDAAYNDTFVNQQIEYAASRGVVLVAGAGNDSGRVTMPASHPDVIAVGAVDRHKQAAWYSNYGPELDLVAPGGDTRRSRLDGVLSTNLTSGSAVYSYQQGTSFAAPHVTGIVALMYSAGITDAQEIRDLLRYTAEDLGAPGFDHRYGWGLVNAYAAVTRSDPIHALVGVAAADGSHVWGPVHPQRQGGQAVARVEGLVPGRHTVFGWIDAYPDGLMGPGDFAGLAEVAVPEDGTVSVDLPLAIWDTLPAADQSRLAALIHR